MRCKRALLVLVLVVVVFVGACGGDETKDSPTAAGRGAVTMKLIAFKPDAITVKAGTSVTWTQTDPGVHTVTSGTVVQGTGGVTEMPNGTFDSGDLATGKTFSFTFTAAGTYTYFCHVHPATMRGTVRVT
jgi:plastocyanin